MASRQINVEIVGDADSLRKAFKQTSDDAGKFGSKMKGAFKLGALGAAVGGIALVSKGLQSSVAAALEAEKAEVRFKGAMDQVSASAQQRAAAQDAINKVSRQAALDDEDLSDVFAKLARSTGDVTKAQQGMALAADIARARNISLEAASKTVEKGMLGNVTAFKKVGLELGKGTTATEALEAAQKKFGGAAKQYGDSAAGAQDKLGVAFENLQEKVGQKLLPVLAKLATKLTEMITWAEANWPRFEKAIQPVVDALDDVWKAVQTMWKIMQPILEVLIPAAFKVVSKAIEVQLEIWKGMATVVTTVVNTILKIVDKFLGGFQAIAEAASHLPFVGDKFKGVADKIGDAREKVRELQQSIDNLRSKEITVTVNTIHHEQSISGGARGGRAAGGPVSAGVPYWVGERGKELFMPAASGTIVPHRPSMAMAGGGNTYVFNFPNYVGDKRELMQLVRDETAKYKRANGRTALA